MMANGSKSSSGSYRGIIEGEKRETVVDRKRREDEVEVEEERLSAA